MSVFVGIPYVAASILIAYAFVGGTRRSSAQLFVVGNVAIGSMFAILTAAGLREAFVVVVGLLAVVGAIRVAFAWRARRYRSLPSLRRVARHCVLFAVIAALATRASWFADRLPLDAAGPRGFAWLDTPLWLTLAYGVERGGLPPPDLLFSGAKVSYHVGAFVLVAAVRRLTGLPMHQAYFLVLASHATALCLVLRDLFTRAFAVRGVYARLAVALVGVAWLEFLIFNLSTLFSVTVALVILAELMAIRRLTDDGSGKSAAPRSGKSAASRKGGDA